MTPTPFSALLLQIAAIARDADIQQGVLRSHREAGE